MGIVGIGAGALILLLLTLLIMRVRRNPSDEVDDLQANLEIENTQEIAPMVESLQGIDQTNEVEEQSELEWLEYPEGAGQWYYRNPGDEDWIIYQQ